MKATILSDAEDDLELAFDYYESRRPGLGGELVEEFRRAVDRILTGGNRSTSSTGGAGFTAFPSGVIYRIDATRNEIVIVAMIHLSRSPGDWRGRS